jgi:hypothetical protein
MSRTNSAGSSITDLIGVTPVLNLEGGQPPAYSFPELGAETFLAGEMVCLSGSAGNAVGITKCGTDASGFGVAGFAADNASSSTSSKKAIFVALPSIVFQANIGHSVTSASAQTAATDVGQVYGLTSLSGRTYVDKYKTSLSNVLCRVLALDDRDAQPSFYGRVQFQMLANKCQLINHENTATSGFATLP